MPMVGAAAAFADMEAAGLDRGERRQFGNYWPQGVAIPLTIVPWLCHRVPKRR
jgi:hypothetical protein